MGGATGERPTPRASLRGLTVADFPELAAQWDEARNGKRASAAKAASTIVGWWRCSDGHTFQKSPGARFIWPGSRITRCPLCRLAELSPVASRTVADFPTLLAEWDAERNGKSASSVRAGSNKMSWWRCAAGHAFQKSPNGRTNNRRARAESAPCPLCYAESIANWTWETIVERAQETHATMGFLPPAGWFTRNDLATLVKAVYDLGRTWDELRAAVGDSFERSRFVQSRSGIRWLSHAEASLSNYLYARGVKHSRGRKYDGDYAEASGKAYGYYDLHFSALDGRTIDVEIWGDKPLGHNEEEYARVRAIKEAFHADRDNFLGIGFRSCYEDTALDAILQPYIGRIEPYIFDLPTDAAIQSAHWSNADELLVECKRIAAMCPDGIFPHEQWLRKRGTFADREGDAYNTLAVYIKLWLGGVRNVRSLLGQSEHSTLQWNRDSALAAFKEWWEQYGRSPGAIKSLAERGKMQISQDELDRGTRIGAAVENYAGGVIAACDALGFAPSRRYGDGRKRVPNPAWAARKRRVV